jgi:hypothetical protein
VVVVVVKSVAPTAGPDVDVDGNDNDEVVVADGGLAVVDGAGLVVDVSVVVVTDRRATVVCTGTTGT